MATNENNSRPDSFVFYRSFFDAIEQASDEEQLKLYRGITIYALNGTEPEFKGLLQAVWLVIRPQIEANYKRYLNGCKGAEHGKKGGRPKHPQTNNLTTPQKPQENPNLTPNVNYNDKVNNNDDGYINIENKKTTKRDSRFVAPTLEDIKNYIYDNSLSNNPDNEAEKAFDYYTSKGWKVGNAPMKDWKAAIRNWCRRGYVPTFQNVNYNEPRLNSPSEDKGDFSDRF